MTDNIPTFNLKAVVQETGLKPDTLRAWERRYGVPNPDRTTGGHRLYSQHEINLLKWLLQRQTEGLSISRAVALLRSIEEEGRDPFVVYPLPSEEALGPTYRSFDAGDTIAELRQAWIDACLAYDEQRAEMVLTQALAYYPPEIVCFELLQKALVEIGEGWYSGDVSVQQEHFTSALAMRRLDSLLAAVPAPTRPGRILVGCPPGESHTFGPLLITYLLRRRGWDVVYLGANVPTDRLMATIEKTQPDLVVFSAQLLETAASLIDVADYLAGIDVPLAFGGYIFTIIPELHQRIRGHYLGPDLSQTTQNIERLLQKPAATGDVIAVGPGYRAAHDYFVSRAGLIESTLWQAMQGPSTANGSKIENAIHNTTRSIAAALKLGDVGYLGTEIEWVQGLMINHNIDPAELTEFLDHYSSAAELALPEPRGSLVVDWLRRAADIAVPAATSGNA